MTNRRQTKRLRGRAPSACPTKEGIARRPPVTVLADVIADVDGCIELPGIRTDPGCDHELHSLEVEGAMMALAVGARWNGWSVMDCGCRLGIVGRCE